MSTTLDPEDNLEDLLLDLEDEWDCWGNPDYEEIDRLEDLIFRNTAFLHTSAKRT